MISLRAAALMLPLALLSCAAPPPLPPPTDPRISLAPGLPISADAPSVSTTNGMMRVAVLLSNGTDRDVPVITTTEWIDAAAQPMRSVMSAPRRMTIPRFGDATIDSLAPRSDAVGFRVNVAPDSAN